MNLTGADMVIHYDPWWNLSAENQATDRTYRIGQKKNVQVYKLITKNSIEERIYELQQKKQSLWTICFLQVRLLLVNFQKMKLWIYLDRVHYYIDFLFDIYGRENVQK